MTKLPVKWVQLHKATMIWGIHATHETINETKVPGVEMYRIPGDGLYITMQDKNTKKMVYQSIPDAGVAMYVYQDKEPLVDEKKTTKLK